MRNFNTTLAVSGALEAAAKVQLLCPLVRGEALCQFDMFFADSESMELLTVEYIIKGLALYFPLVNLLFKKKRCAAE